MNNDIIIIISYTVQCDDNVTVNELYKVGRWTYCICQAHRGNKVADPCDITLRIETNILLQ